MSAHKRPYWPEAWELLLQRKCIQLTPGKRRQQTITLTDLPAWAEPKQIIKRRRRKRPQSDWFKFILPVFLDRDGYDEKSAPQMLHSSRTGVGGSETAGRSSTSIGLSQASENCLDSILCRP